MVLFAYKFDEKCSEDTEQINKQSWLNVAVIIYMKIEACYDHSTKMNIVLIVPDNSFNGIPECSDGIHNNSEVTGGQGEAAT